MFFMYKKTVCVIPTAIATQSTTVMIATCDKRVRELPQLQQQFQHIYLTITAAMNEVFDSSDSWDSDTNKKFVQCAVPTTATTTTATQTSFRAKTQHQQLQLPQTYPQSSYTHHPAIQHPHPQSQSSTITHHIKYPPHNCHTSNPHAPLHFIWITLTYKKTLRSLTPWLSWMTQHTSSNTSN